MKVSNLLPWLVGLFFLSLVFPVWAKELPVRLDAQYLKYQEDLGLIVASGEVKLSAEDFSLSADQLLFDLNTNVFTAEGQVDFRVGDDYTAQADDLTYNVSTEVSHFSGFKTVMYPKRIKGKLILDADDLTDYTTEMKGKEGKMTTCDLASPHYRFLARRVELFPGDKVVGYSVTFVVGQVPVFWTPIYIYSLKKKSQRFPAFGYNDVEGDFVKTTWDYFINNHAYGLLYIDYMSKKGWGYGALHEYDFWGNQEGDLYVYHVDEKDTRLSDWVTKIKHTYKLNPWAALTFTNEYSNIYLLPSGRSDRTFNSLGLNLSTDAKVDVSYSQDMDRRFTQATDSFLFSRTKGATRTSFNYKNYRKFNGYSDDSSTLNHTQPFFDDNLTFTTNANYRKNIANLSSPADERVDPDIAFDYKGAFYTLRYYENWYLDLDQNRYTLDNNVRFLERQPELTMALASQDYSLFKLTPSLGYGWYHEAEYVPLLGRLRHFASHRYWLDLAATKDLPLGFGTTLGLGAFFKQIAYDPGDAQYTASGLAGLKTDVFSFVRNNFSYEKKDTAGNSPFMFDRLGAYSNYWRDVLTFYYLKAFAWDFRGGYNYLTKDWDDLQSTLAFSPFERFRLQFDSGYRIEEKNFLDFVTRCHIEPLPKFNFDFYSVHDINQGLIKSANNLTDIEIGGEDHWQGHWKFRLFNEYDVFKQQLMLRDLMVIKDLHCWEFKFTYSDLRKTFSFAFTLKAIPDEPFGWASERGFYMESFEKEKAEYWQSSPRRY